MRAQLSEAIARLAALREELKAAVDADAEAYNAGDEGVQGGEGVGERQRGHSRRVAPGGWCAAGRGEKARGSGADCGAAAEPITNPKMSSDLTTAIALARAAIEGARANVEINLESMQQEAPQDAFIEQARRRLVLRHRR